ncbi:MAG: cytochrome P450 [Gammaproteobacteria bacterium]|nr:cytochrome P450 [Gammaproteobacteria bacterium]
MSTMDRPQIFTITRYLEARRVLMDPLTFSSARPLTTMAGGLGYSFVLFCQDPPEHGRLRTLIQREFISSRLQALRGWIESEVDTVLDGYPLNPAEVDIVAALTLPLPMRVINRLLGVADADSQAFKRWTTKAVGHQDGELPAALGRRAFVELHKFFRGQIRANREQPTDGVIGHLLTRCADELELINFCVTLMIAGNETTASLLSNLLHLLATRPALWRALREDRSLIGAVIEETLRFDPPIQFVSRLVTRPVVVEGVQLSRGDTVLVNIGAANRDPEFFAKPEVFNLVRREKGHLAFSHGLHYCIGASLTRLEAEIVLNKMLDRYVAIALAAPSERYPNAYFRGFKSLHLSLQRTCPVGAGLPAIGSVQISIAGRPAPTG